MPTENCYLHRVLPLVVFFPLLGAAQPEATTREILERLARLEQQNAALRDEIQSLRRELAGGSSPRNDAERLDVQEQRVSDLAQSKIESDHRLPVQLTGMVLFNAFLNGRSNGDRLYPLTAAPSSGLYHAGASLQQTVIGLRFQGPEVLNGAKVSGSVYMDFFSGSGQPVFGQNMRLRLGTVDLAWKNTTLTVGQDKPIIAPREPESLAQVGDSPLSNAGNLWLWQPQARMEQRFSLGRAGRLRAQAGIYQTAESLPGLALQYQTSLATSRPSGEGRLEWSREWDNAVRLELAAGFHGSQSHIVGQSVPSRIYSLDWLFRPAGWTDFTGTYFRGENVNGLGALRQGITVLYGRGAIPVHSEGGWGQWTFRLTDRLSTHLMAGQQADRALDLPAGGISRNLLYGGNVMYRIGSNVVTAFEATQTRTTYIGSGIRLNNHYDLALGYLF